MGFHLGTLHGYFFHQDFWPNFNFPLEYQIKLVLSVKIQASGISGSLLDWLNDYLKNRRQFVEIGDYKSDTKRIDYGVPQGSLLGPRLF